jgi:hypothetical protein
MRRSPSPVVDALAGIGLADVVAAADLQDRVDHKYVVTLDRLEALVEVLATTHAALEIGGLRSFAYETTYYDTACLAAYRAHVQGRRRRWKCRGRAYADSGLRTVEVKLKGACGRTVKHRVEGEASAASARALLEASLLGAYGRRVDGELRPVLGMRFVRTTLVAPALGERLTCDADLRFDGGGALADGRVILESKSRGGRALADRVLRAMGVRPVEGCSKYCLGIALTRPSARANAQRGLLRRHFEAAAG